MSHPLRVQVESPFRPKASDQTVYRVELVRNIKYAQLCMLDSLSKGEAPFLSHLLYTQVWSEELRDAGIAAGLSWLRSADLHAFYTDRGMSGGMKSAIANSPIRCVGRTLFESEGEMLEALDGMAEPQWAELRVA